MRPLLCVLALAVCATAQQPTPDGLSPQAPKAPADGVILGTVVNTRGEPLAGAWVLLNGGSAGESVGRHAASDAAGRVRFDGLPNGNYSLQAKMAGRLFERQGRQVVLEGSKAEGSFEIVLARKPVLTGRVFDPAGIPLERARVQIFRRTFDESGERIVANRSVSTDDRGIYRIALEEPGRHWLMASHTEASFPRGSAPRVTGIAFYPNAPDLLAAGAIDLAFDQPEQSFEITLPFAPPTALTAAIVSGPASNPCEQCSYSLRKVDGQTVYEIISGGTARQLGFSYAGIPAGLYRVYVQDFGPSSDWWAIHDVVVAEGRHAEALIATAAPVRLAGNITLRAAPAMLSQTPREATEPLQLTVVQEQNLGFFGTRNGVNFDAQLDLDKLEFSFDPLPPGTVRFSLRFPGANAYLAGISHGGRALESPILDLTQPGPWTDLELVVRFDPAETKVQIAARGSASSDETTYRIVVIPDAAANPFGRRYEGTCEAGTECTIMPLPPGRYRAIAFPGLNSSQPNLHDPEVWQRLRPWTRDVTLVPGSNPIIRLAPAPEERGVPQTLCILSA